MIVTSLFLLLALIHGIFSVPIVFDAKGDNDVIIELEPPVLTSQKDLNRFNDSDKFDFELGDPLFDKMIDDVTILDNDEVEKYITVTSQPIKENKELLEENNYLNTTTTLQQNEAGFVEPLVGDDEQLEIPNANSETNGEIIIRDFDKVSPATALGKSSNEFDAVALVEKINFDSEIKETNEALSNLGSQQLEIVGLGSREVGYKSKITWNDLLGTLFVVFCLCAFVFSMRRMVWKSFISSIRSRNHY